MTTKNNTRENLRVGVMVDGMTVPAWVHRILTEVHAAHSMELSVFILDGELPPRDNLPSRLRRGLATSMYALYERLDRSIYRKGPDAFAPVNIADHFPSVAVLRLVSVRDPAMQGLSGEDVNAVRTKRLDVILCFGFEARKGDLVPASVCGVWSCDRGGIGNCWGTPAFFREIYETDPVSCGTLQAFTEAHPEGLVIYRSYARTNLTSLWKSRAPSYWKASHFMTRRLRDLYEHGWDHIQGLAADAGTKPHTANVRGVPGNGTMCSFLLTLVGRYLYSRFRFTLFHAQWEIGLRRRRKFNAAGFKTDGFELIHAPPGRFYADPFLLKRGATNYLFFEDWNWSNRRSVISYCTLDADGHPSPAKVVLELDCNVSYPCVFEYEGNVYMTPETKDNRTVELYRATDFPERWELVHVIFEDVVAVDPTICRHANRFWLFLTMAVAGGSYNDETFLFYANSPLGTWTPHPMNPVVSDVRRARGAGKLLVENGQIIRPSQDCSRTYGYQIILSRIETLTVTDYKDVEIGRIGPDWIPKGTGSHTFNRNEDFEVLDGRAYLFKWFRRDQGRVPNRRSWR